MPAQVLIELIPDLSKVESGLDELQRKGTVSDGAASAYKAGNAELQKREQLISKNVSAQSKADATDRKHVVTLQDLQKNTSKLSDTVLKQIASLSQDAATTKKVEAATESLRTEKKRLQAQIADLIITGQQESAMFQQLTTRAGEIDDAMKDAADAISRTGSDTRGLDTTIQLAQGVAAGFTVATATTALFGEESEEVQQVLLKVNAAMALLNGLQEIQNLLKSEYIKTLAASISTQNVQNASIAIENGLNSKSIVVRTGAAVAQRVLNAAMAMNPLGLFVTALALVIGALGTYTIATAKGRKAQEDLDRAMEATTMGIDEQIDALNNLNSLRIASLESVNAAQSDILRQDLSTFKEITDQKEILVKNLWAAIIAAQKAGVKVSKEDIDTWSKLYDEVVNRRSEAQVKERQIAKQTLDESNKQTQAAADRAIKIARNGSNAEIAAKLASAKTSRDLAMDELRRQEELLGSTVAITEQRMNVEAEYNDTVETLTNELLDRQRAASQRRLSAERDAIDNLILVTREGTQKQLDLQIQAINKQAELDKAGIETRNTSAAQVAKERANIERKAQAEIARMKIEFRDKQVKDEAGIELVLAQARVAAFREGTAEYYQAQREFLAQQADNQSLDVQQSVDSEEVKAAKIKLIYTQLHHDISALTRQQQEELIARQQASIDALNNLALTRLNIKASDPNQLDGGFKAQQDIRTEELRQIHEQRAAIHQKALTDQLYREQQYEADLTNNTAKGEAKRAEIIQANATRIKEIREQLAAEAIRLAQETANAIFDNERAERDMELQAKLDDLNKEKEAAINTKNLTERQKSDIQKKYNQEERRLKNEAARKERKAAVNQAIVNGLLAVTSALATVHPTVPAGVIAAASAAITAGIQVAKMNSTPLPAYAKGTLSAKRGYAWVGEQGPEIVKLNGGERIYTATQSDKIMKEWNAANHTATISEHRASHQSSATDMDYDAMGKAVAKHLPKQPSVNMVADKNGLTIFLQHETSKTTIRNSRYSSGS